MTPRTIIIAEAGVNHNGDIEIAKKIIAAAKEAGADFVKFQTFNASRQATYLAKKANYQKKTTPANESQYEMLKKLELSKDMHRMLIQSCKDSDIAFLSSSFDIESTSLLISLEQEVLKIPSGEITNLPYLRHIGSFNKKLIISTGMATLDEIGSAIKVIVNEGTNIANLTLLHCTSEYPAPIEEVNLLAMNAMSREFNLEVGYSDHTEGIEVAIAAVALGAKVIEKHFTLDRNLIGPDHKASIEPNDFKKMVLAIRNIEKALGNEIKKPTQSEISNISTVRKSIVAKTPIKIGENFTADNLTVKRPGSGVSPMLWDRVINKKASKSYEIDDLIDI
jgi:N,N'-diacetyllegionaminate synthase